MSDAVNIKGLRKSFGDTEVLKGIDLTVRRGEMVAITGESGTGKTTLLRTINMLEGYNEGEVKVFGKRLPADGGLRRDMLMVFQKPVLLNTSVFRNLSYGLRIRRSQDIEKKVTQALTALGLKGKIHEQAPKLSGGEAQRVALAHFLVLRPKLLLLDEPTANLDLRNAGIVEKLIKDANDDGMTVIISTHDTAHARRLCKKTYVLKGGKLR